MPIAQHLSATPPPPLYHRSISVQRISRVSFLFFIVPFTFLFSAARKNLVTDNNLTLTDAVQRIVIYTRYYDAIQHTHSHTRSYIIHVCVDPTFYTESILG